MKKQGRTRPRTEARAADGTVLLDDVSFSVPRGSIVAVVGPTGAGKTTLLNALTGAIDVSAGTVLLDHLHTRRVEITHKHDVVFSTIGCRSDESPRTGPLQAMS